MGLQTIDVYYCSFTCFPPHCPDWQRLKVRGDCDIMTLSSYGCSQFHVNSCTVDVLTSSTGFKMHTPTRSHTRTHTHVLTFSTVCLTHTHTHTSTYFLHCMFNTHTHTHTHTHS